MAQLASGGVRGPFEVRSAGQPVLDAWERDYFTCGSAVKRDDACLSKLRAKQAAAWRAAVERQRLALCPRWQSQVKQVRDCLTLLATGPEDGLAKSERQQAWAVLFGLHTFAEPLMCPAEGPELVDPIDDRR
jgi:hypothetical protein